MDTYMKLRIQTSDNETKELLIALLAAQGYEGFSEEEAALEAFIPLNAFNEGAMQEMLSPLSTPYTKEIIQPQNWNAIWEQSFEPVVIPGFATIRASFHPAREDAAYDIVITPKMSFGTGHHATTLQMMQLMQNIDMKGKRVFDFGTGTGVLAILAEKMGAAEVLAIDYDAWSIENTLENIQRNGCERIRAVQQDQPPGDAQFAIVLANITRSTLLEYMASIAACMKPGAMLLVSGFYTNENHLLEAAAADHGLMTKKHSSIDNWSAIQFIKNT